MQMTDVMYDINKLNSKNHMIVSTDLEKVFDKIQHPFIITSENWVWKDRFSTQSRKYMKTQR